MQVTPEKKETPSSEEVGPKSELEKGKTTELPTGSETLWRAIIAALLSLVFAGLGHLYLRRYGRAFLYLLLGLFLLRTSGYSPRAMMLNIILFVFSAFDAFSLARRGYGIV